MRLAQRGRDRRRVVRLDAPAGKTDLPRVVPQRFGAPRQQHMRAAVAFDERDQYRRGPQRELGRQQIEEVGAVPAGPGGRFGQRMQRAVEASDRERRRIAQDLHDGVVQDLTAVSYALSAAAATAPEPVDEQLRDAAAETRRGIRHLRTLLVDIYPPELHREGLPAALADLLTGPEARGIATSLDVDPAPLGPEQEALLFRVAQEAVRNVVEHAGASRLAVSVHRVDGRVRLEDRGLISGKWVEKAGERRRRFYRLTPTGREVLERQRSAWEEFSTAINQILRSRNA